MDRPFPDVTPILAAKEEHRNAVRRLSLGEKIAMMEALRERVAPIKAAREARAALRRSTPDPDRQ